MVQCKWGVGSLYHDGFFRLCAKRAEAGNKNEGQEDDSSDFIKGGIKDESKTHTYFFEVHLKLNAETYLHFIVVSGFSKIKNMKPDK